MFRRIALALIAATALGIGTVAPPASATSLHEWHSAYGGSRLGWGWGYGRGWCYWHPYACYRY